MPERARTRSQTSQLRTGPAKALAGARETADRPTGLASEPASSSKTRSPGLDEPVQLSLDAELAEKVAFVAGTESRRKLFDQFVTALHESPPNSDATEMLELVSARFVQLLAKARIDDANIAEASSASEVKRGWNEILERSREYKASLLGSNQFRSVAQVSKLLGISEKLVQQRIHRKTMFALTDECGGDLRIPIWSLDKRLAPSDIRRLLECAERAGMGPWAFQLFMNTPDGDLDGRHPVDVLTLKVGRGHLESLCRSGLVLNPSKDPRRAALETVCAALVRQMEV